MMGMQMPEGLQESLSLAPPGSWPLVLRDYLLKSLCRRKTPLVSPRAKVGDYQSALGEQAHRRPRTWGVVAMAIGLP